MFIPLTQGPRTTIRYFAAVTVAHHAMTGGIHIPADDYSRAQLTQTSAAAMSLLQWMDRATAAAHRDKVN